MTIITSRALTYGRVDLVGQSFHSVDRVSTRELRERVVGESEGREWWEGEGRVMKQAWLAVEI